MRSYSCLSATIPPSFLSLSLFSLYSFDAARESGIWAVKKRLERGAFGVQGKMVSASARSGISGSDRVAQRGFLWVMHEVSPILLRVPRSTSRSAAPGSTGSSAFLVPPLRLASHRVASRRRHASSGPIHSRSAIPVPFTEREVLWVLYEGSNH